MIAMWYCGYRQYLKHVSFGFASTALSLVIAQECMNQMSVCTVHQNLIRRMNQTCVFTALLVFFLSLITYEFPIPARLPRAWFVHSPWQHDRILGILWVKSWAFQFGLGDESEMDGKRDNH